MDLLTQRCEGLDRDHQVVGDGAVNRKQTDQNFLRRPGQRYALAAEY